MNALAVALGFATPLSPAAAVPGFPAARITLPALSLADAAREALPPVFRENAAWIRPYRPSPKIVPKMQIVIPKRNPDPRIAVAPDASVDYKLRITDGDGHELKQ